MPIIAVAAIAAGAAVTTGVIAVSTMAMIGLATTVVGKVTKSKLLTQIGSGLSLGAGVSSVASSVFGTTEAAGGVAATAGTGEVVTGAEGVAETAGGGVSSAAGTGEAIESAAEAASTGGAAAGTEGLTEGLSGVEAAGANSGGLLNATPQATAPLSATPQASVASDAIDTLGAPASGAGVTASSVAPPLATDSNSILTWWSKQPDAVKNRLLQVGGQAASGLMEGWSQEQKLAFERERQKLEQEKYDTSMKNASAQPVVRFKNYTPQPTPAAGGLLNPQRG